MGAMTRMQIDELATRNEEPGWFDAICADIANGATVDAAYAKLTNEYAVSWGALRTWIRADEKREQAYQDALSARLEYRREKVAANVAAMAAVDHKDVRPSDTLRAAELVLNSGATVSVSGGSGPRSITVMFVDAVEGKPAERVVNG